MNGKYQTLKWSAVCSWACAQPGELLFILATAHQPLLVAIPHGDGRSSLGREPEGAECCCWGGLGPRACPLAGPRHAAGGNLPHGAHG